MTPKQQKILFGIGIIAALGGLYLFYISNKGVDVGAYLATKEQKENRKVTFTR